MITKANEKQKALIKLQKHLLDIEEEQNNGAKYYSVDELDAVLSKIIDKA